KVRLGRRLWALEVQYHELGGLYDQLAAAGRFDGVVLMPDEVERAAEEPPPGGRAALRATTIRAAAGDGWTCDWEYVWHRPTGACVDLRDPFSGEMRRAT